MSTASSAVTIKLGLLQISKGEELRELATLSISSSRVAHLNEGIAERRSVIAEATLQLRLE